MGDNPTWYRRSFMGRLPEPAQQGLLALGHTQLLDPGATLIRQGDPGGVAYLLLDGRVNVTKVAENGTQSLLAIRYPGDLIGEMAVISAEPRAATVVGRVKTTLLTLPGDEFVRFLGEHPMAALALSAITGDRLMQAHAYRTDAAAYPVEVRVARALLYQGQRMAHQSDGFFFLDLKQSELAMLIGAKEGTVQKALAQGEHLPALVENRRGRVMIRDLPGLAAFAELSGS
ncbi:Crp/Fnr family transcriptional regulator [Actinocorallia longicatena]|uniref:Crp/Fnr family transcriptional regulator n=1 Tax=Actinocorallia longicatena TaxID=111803 RepID=A0ABP6Q2G5_9ACTN